MNMNCMFPSTHAHTHAHGLLLGDNGGLTFTLAASRRCCISLDSHVASLCISWPMQTGADARTTRAPSGLPAAKRSAR